MKESNQEERTEGHFVFLSREAIGNTVVQLVEWLVPHGSWVERGQPIAVLETSKAAFEVDAERDGYLFHLALEGAEVSPGEPVALISVSRQDSLEGDVLLSSKGERVAEAPLITRKARERMDVYGLSVSCFPGMSVVRSSDVESFQRARKGDSGTKDPLFFGGEELDPDADWDAVCVGKEYQGLMQLMTQLRRRMKARHKRHVPTGDLLYDRWQLARDYGFGDGTSVYETCLIQGDVRVGTNCWIGPFTVLDGRMATLAIGDSTSIGSGSQLYTHNTMARTLSGGVAPVHRRETTIGSCCFIAPMVAVAPGTVIGDHCFVASGSLVEGIFPDFSYIAGSPAKLVGWVEIKGSCVILRRGEKRR